MARKAGSATRASLIHDIFNAEYDVVTLAQTHGLSPEDLAAWASEPANQQCLTGLCVLADIQTQLFLSRYRMHAATRLVRLATQEDTSASADVARKACVDLLRLDLKRADANANDGDNSDSADESDAAALRAMLYGEASDDDSTAEDA